jgi:hypothetical protein
MRTFTRPCRVTLIMVCALTFCVYAQAVNLKVNCNSTGTLSAINGALKLLNPQGPNTLTVSGNCKENVVIQSFDRLSLIANSGASINDVSGGTVAVVDIEDSHSVTLNGFTINGGRDGVLCNTSSVCYLTANTVQSALGQQGVGVMNGSHAFLTGNAIENNTLRGLTVNEGSQVFSTNDTFRDNPGEGIVANSGAYVAATNSSIQNNGSDGAPGVVASDHSALRLISCTISGNGSDGVVLQDSADARFDSYSGPSTVTGNAGSGVSVQDLSFAFFGPGANITGNLSGTDVLCSPQFSATRGAHTNIGGGMTMNCTEP